MFLVDEQILIIEQLEKVLVLMSRLQHTEVSLKVQQFVINLRKQRLSERMLISDRLDSLQGSAPPTKRLSGPFSVIYPSPSTRDFRRSLYSWSREVCLPRC